MRSIARKEPYLFGFVATLILTAVLLPFVVARYPAICDFPIGVKEGSILRNFHNPAWHFSEQFRIRPLNPYYPFAFLSAAFGFIFPQLIATKIVAIILLLLIPIGLGNTLHALHKSPYMAVASLPLIWGTFTHWGVFNFMGAVGLTALSTGLAIRLSEWPSLRNTIFLMLSLVAVFMTHVVCVPFAITSAICISLLTFNHKSSIWRIILAIAPVCLLFSWWWWFGRPSAFRATISLDPEFSRLESFREWAILSFPGEAEKSTWTLFFIGLSTVCTINLSHRLIHSSTKWRLVSLRTEARIAIALMATFCLFFYISMPITIGAWGYAYPRISVLAIIFGMMLLPDFPKNVWARYPLVLVLAGLSFNYVLYIAGRHHTIGRLDRGFDEVAEQLPMAPRLYFKQLDPYEYSSITMCYAHVHEYIQAERGGWINENAILMSASPVTYRDDLGPALRSLKSGGMDDPFYEWLMFRSQGINPAAVIPGNLTVRLVEHRGYWWLYRKGH